MRIAEAKRRMERELMAQGTPKRLALILVSERFRTITGQEQTQ